VTRPEVRKRLSGTRSFLSERAGQPIHLPRDTAHDCEILTSYPKVASTPKLLV
jgi:hypothetical protein